MDDSAIVDQLPKQRKLWVSIILSLLKPGLPSIYCGNLKTGIIIEVAINIIILVMGILMGIFPGLFMVIILLFTFLALFFGFLIYNIKLTLKTNCLQTPRIKKMGWIILLVAILSFGLDEGLGRIIEWKFVEAYSMPATSMENTIFVGDYLIATKDIDPSGIQSGDLVIFKYPGNARIGYRDKGTNYIKRAVALGGQTIEIVNKQVFVNGEPFNELSTVIKDTIRISPHYRDNYQFGPGNRDNMPEITVPEGKLFVLGDNRDNSSDSRFWGYVSANEVIGKARFIHFSWDSENNRIRWERLGLRLDN